MSQFRGFGNSHDGDATPSGDINTRTSCSGSSGSKTLTVSSTSGFFAGDMVYIGQERGTGVGAWEIAIIASVTATLNLVHNLVNTYTDGGSSQSQCVLVPQYRGVTISGTVSPGDWGGNVGGVMAFVCSGLCTVTGTISANGGVGSVGDGISIAGGVGPGFSGGTGDHADPSQAQCGENTSADHTETNAAVANGGGGGNTSGGSPGVGGGGGGNGAVGGTADGGGGATAGSADLTTMVFGGGGGGGANDGSESAGTAVGGGGSGGGKIIIFAREFDCSGATIIKSDGGSGGDAQPGAEGGDGGGGAGGSILIKAVKATMGTSKVTVSGGSGNTNGGIGGAGRRRVEACSITGSGFADSEQEGGQDYCGSVAQILGG